MKNNQFALLPVDSSQVISELKDIKFIDETVSSKKTVGEVYQVLLEKSFPQTTDKNSLKTKLSNLLATPTLDLNSWLETKQLLTADIFYRVALQLLEFLPEDDFDINNPLFSMDLMHLPTLQTNSFDKETLYEAWYLLLNTHTKNGKNLIDRLATKGYFADFVSESDIKRPLIFNGKAQPVYDTNALIREVVYIETDFDTDFDGKLDLIKAEIIRPVESNSNPVPVLYTASPYNQGTNDKQGEQLTHNVNVKLEQKQPNNLKYEDIKHTPNLNSSVKKRVINAISEFATESFSREQSYTLNDYFLARGYAVVYSAGIGSMDSEGLQTTGDEYEVQGAKAVVEWLAQNRIAFTNKVDNIEIKATWSNKKVAMTGRSYLGTLATGVATTGVLGLETIVSEAAISSWYDYYRSNGLVVAPGGFQGEDSDVLAEETFSRRKNPGDFIKIYDTYQKYLDQMCIDQDRKTGSYNEFWDARNYLKDVKNIKADIIMVHGLNDWNVKPQHVNNLWRALKDVNVNKKIILHQGQHIYINSMRSIDFTDMLNLWFSYKLYDIDNHAVELLPNVIVQDNTKVETWHVSNSWDEVKNKTLYHLNENQLSSTNGHKENNYIDQIGSDLFKKYIDNPTVWDNDIKTEKSSLSTNRLLYKTTEFKQNKIIDGRVKVNLRVKSSVAFGMISVQLVDYGEELRLNPTPTSLGVKLDSGFRWREDILNEFTLAKNKTPFKMITKGHINLQNRENSWKNDPLNANEYVSISFYLQPTFYKLLATHQLGLIVYSTDFSMTIRGNQNITYTIDEAKSSIEVPLT